MSISLASAFNVGFKLAEFEPQRSPSTRSINETVKKQFSHYGNECDFIIRILKQFYNQLLIIVDANLSIPSF